MTAHHADQDGATNAPLVLPLPLALLVVGAAQHYKSAAGAQYDTAREIIGQPPYLSEGASVPIRDPRDGTKLGMATVSDPSPAADVHDEAAFLEHVRTTQPDGAVTSAPAIRPDVAMDDVLEVLGKHAPDMVTDVESIAPWARKAALDAILASGDPAPGVAIGKRPGVVSVKPVKGTEHRYRELVAAGRVDPLLELAPATPTGE